MNFGDFLSPNLIVQELSFSSLESRILAVSPRFNCRSVTGITVDDEPYFFIGCEVYQLQDLSVDGQLADPRRGTKAAVEGDCCYYKGVLYSYNELELIRETIDLTC